ncbi:MAG: P-type conjugative transfer ATPase TrbB [Pseudomonadota bacterium]
MSERSDQSLQRTQAMLTTAMGPQIVAALDDPSVVEVLANPDGCLWIERHGAGRVQTDSLILATQAERVIRLVASHMGQDVTRDHPIVSAELPGSGDRFEGVLPPVATAPCFSIRKAAAQAFTLEDYVSAGTLSPVHARLLKQAVLERQNILIVGGTGSGKTTLANALLQEVAHTGDRVVLLEDTRELQCAAADQVALRTAAANAGSAGVTLADLVKSTLRLRPDRIIIGEVRGPEALDLLKAWNTGHPGGIATIHANSGKDGLHRLEQLVGERAANVPRSLITQAIDLLVFIAGRGPARRVEHILTVLGSDDQDYRCADAAYPDLSLVPSHPSTVGDLP